MGNSLLCCRADMGSAPGCPELCYAMRKPTFSAWWREPLVQSSDSPLTWYIDCLGSSVWLGKPPGNGEAGIVKRPTTTFEMRCATLFWFNNRVMMSYTPVTISADEGVFWLQVDYNSNSSEHVFDSERFWMRWTHTHPKQKRPFTAEAAECVELWQYEIGLHL